MSGYTSLSTVYDRLMEVDYAARAEYLLSLFARHGGKSGMLLDLACGSGTLTVELLRRGRDMIAVDGSEEMLALAAEKAPGALLLCQDMRELDLYGTVDGAVCTLDSFNHLLTTADIVEVLQRLRLFIEPGGLLIFDVNTPYKHREVLANNTFVYELDDVFCVWQNRLLPRTGEVRMLLDIFEETADGRYERLQDEIAERAYSERTWRGMLAEAQFTPLALYGDMTTEPPAAEEQRWVFVARNDRRDD